MKMRNIIFLGVVIGLVIASSAVLSVYLVKMRNPEKILPTRAFQNEKEMISSYIIEARAIHEAYKTGKATREETKAAVLKLTVPGVLKQRHLEWVLNLDAGRDEAIEAMMQEYSVITLVD